MYLRISPSTLYILALELFGIYSTFIRDRTSNSVRYIDIYENRGPRRISGKERRFVFPSRRTNHLERTVFLPKRTERTHTYTHRGGWYLWEEMGEPYSKVFRELKQIPRTWWIRLLVRASRTRRLLSSPTHSSPLPLPPYVRYWALPIVVGIVSAGGRVIASLLGKTETFLPNSVGAGQGRGVQAADDDVH